MTSPSAGAALRP